MHDHGLGARRDFRASTIDIAESLLPELNLIVATKTRRTIANCFAKGSQVIVQAERIGHPLGVVARLVSFDAVKRNQLSDSLIEHDSMSSPVVAANLI